MKINLIGPSYELRSANIDAQRSINLYPTLDETKEGKSRTQLVGSPGLLLFGTLAATGCRAMLFSAASNRAFAVYGNKFYEIFSNGTSTERGTLNTSTGPVGIASNGLQVCCVDGLYGYVFIYATNAFTQITDPDFPGATTVCFVDGYFVFNEPNSGRYFISQLYDGTSFDGLDFATAEGNPDNLVAVVSCRRNIWEMGQASVEVSFNSGAADFPFDRIQGAFMEYGCAAAFSADVLANTIFWVGSDNDGVCTVWMAEQYAPQRISTFAIEYYLSLYLSNIADATSYSYQEEGHFFYVLNIPGMPTTLVYDVTTKQWHERASLNTDTGQFVRHRAQNHMFAFGKHLVGDFENGKLYEQSLNYYDYDGAVIKRLRRAQYIADDLEYIFHQMLQIDIETGVGLSGNAPTEDADPQIILRWSDDGANTWSNEHTRSMGAIGKYSKRVYWDRLGRARSRVYELSTANRCKVNIIGGYIQLEKGTA